MQQATTLPAIRNPSSPGQDSPWHDVMPLADLADAAPRRMQVSGRSFLVVRQGEQVRAFAATCPHKGAPLEQGTLCAGKLVCPWHKAFLT
ncbi:Rieske 2Fe-2S domain-containing protein [Komagataeibacter europaeus]|uniref:Rieske 2Fe-2S domain-containing protein n=1 Tax=Komagataeibacter europaeus TaxID=33995 RepID=UPI0002EDE9BC|nr:Rieske 2Fe-2S domain-containing protein [Komagataeibacter europaeus]